MYKLYHVFGNMPKQLKHVLFIMRLITLLLVAALVQVSAKHSFGQQITLSVKDATFESVIDQISVQSGLNFFATAAVLRKAKPVTLHVDGLALDVVLKKLFKNQPLDYQLVDRSVVIREKFHFAPPANRSGKLTAPLVLAYPQVRGRVVDSIGSGLEGASVRVLNSDGKRTTLQTKTNANGYFELKNVPEDAQLEITYVGHVKQTLSAQPDVGSVTLYAIPSELEEVEVLVNTGYQTLPRERATGSFAQPIEEVYNSRVAPDLLTKLNGITSGLIFNANTSRVNHLGYQTDITIRGRSTIFANDQPLIVLDNFPYYGNINDINPNDVERVTVLKDAAAASIWGAQAGNGVIVIDTKSGKRGQATQISLSLNNTWGEKPNLFYDPAFLPSADYIELERFLFQQGKYNSALANQTTFPVISPVVEWLHQADVGQISMEQVNEELEKLASVDVRQDIARYFYRTAYNQQYALNMNGGNDRSAYYFSAGFDQNRQHEVGNGNKRVTLNFNTVFEPVRRLKFTANLYYSGTNLKNNPTLQAMKNPDANFYPYIQLADDTGQPLPINRGYRKSFVDAMPQNGFLDMGYYPLTESALANSLTSQYGTRAQAGVSFSLLPWLSINGKFQYQQAGNEKRDLYTEETYYVRSYVNQFAEVKDGRAVRFVIPDKSILNLNNGKSWNAHYRFQVDIDKSWGAHHDLNGIFGYEQSETVSSSNAVTLYGYDDYYATSTPLNYDSLYTLYPQGMATIPSGIATNGNTDRFRSSFANFAYRFRQKYTLSVSGRIDGSNYFGVETNKKMVPLWSVGAKWAIDDESFYRVAWLPSLKLSASYGYNGNLDRSLSGIHTFYYLNGATWTNARYAMLMNIGNPNLQWEKAGQIKFGADFSLRRRLSGSLEFYHRIGKDLIGNERMPPSSGVVRYKGNFSAMSGKGVDLTLSSENRSGGLFTWKSTLNLTYATDKVTDYSVTNTAYTQSVNDGAGGDASPVVGRPVFSLHSYRWAGLDGSTGDPMGIVNGQASKDYLSIMNDTQLQDLVYHGPARPTWWGGVTNTFSYKGFTAWATITYKLGYYFRRSAINYAYFINYGRDGHGEFANRWQAPGDELITNVPSISYPANLNRDRFYNFSEITVEPGSHIRLQDFALGYDFSHSLLHNTRLKQVVLQFYVNNVGILWRQNNIGLDPDYPTGFPAARTYSLSLKANF